MKDLAQIARDAGLTVLLDGKIGREEYQSISGNLTALQRFAEAYYEPAGDIAKLVEKLQNRAALQFEDEDVHVMREAARVLQRDHYLQLAREAHAQAAAAPFPDELTPELREVLGWPNFRCGPIAHLMRAAGADIKPKAEDEQAVVLHWFVTLVLRHGANWWDVARTKLAETHERISGAAHNGDKHE